MTLVAMAFIALLCPCSLRSFPMLYVAYVRRVRRPTREANQKPSSTAPSAKTAVSQTITPSTFSLILNVISAVVFPSVSILKVMMLIKLLICMHVCRDLERGLFCVQVTRPVWIWVWTWCPRSRCTRGSAWNARRAPSVNSLITRRKWCSVINVIGVSIPSVWAWTPFLSVSLYRITSILIWLDFSLYLCVAWCSKTMTIFFSCCFVV